MGVDTILGLPVVGAVFAGERLDGLLTGKRGGRKRIWHKRRKFRGNLLRKRGFQSESRNRSSPVSSYFRR